MPVFRVERPEPGLAHLVMDDPRRKVNLLDETAIADLETALSELGRAPAPRGVVLRSGKSGTFIAGADVNVIAAATDKQRVLEIVRTAQEAFQRLASLPFPTVAAIDGACLGGGTELALACDSRVASEEPRTQIGLPEVLLGIFPAFGGTTRLPRLVGVTAALDLVLTGRALDARRAERIGLVARAVPAAWLLESAHRRLAELASLKAGRRRERYRPRGLGAWLLENSSTGRALVFRRARSMTRARTGGQYPAPLAAISVMQRGLGRPLEAGLKLEADAVCDLVVGPVCKNLIRLFQLSEQAKKTVAGVDPGLKPLPVAVLSQVGAGVMGGGIAELASRAGLEVRLRDVQPAALTRALQTARSVIEGRTRKRRGPKSADRPGADREVDAQMARIFPTLELTGVRRADLAIEAVIEDVDVKRRVFGELEVRMRPDAILATNTSSLSVTDLAGGLQHPDRFCGLHFFNPVHRMPLVEVVRGSRTSDLTLVTAVDVARRLGKTPVVVADAPGFVVNRILMPYLREAMHQLEEGYRIRDVDAAMRRFGMPMGPFEVLDEVGLDVAQKVAAILSRAFPERMAPAPGLDRLVEVGRLGKKSGLGFYRHAGGRRKPDRHVRGLLKLARQRSPQSLEALSERLLLAMINEAARCVEERVAESAGMIDLAMVFGAGFPPFRGGPIRYADTLGLQRIETRLAALRAEKGERFKPASLLSRLAASGGTLTGPAAVAR